MVVRKRANELRDEVDIVVKVVKGLGSRFRKVEDRLIMDVED